jgi:hypothetical protein
MIAVHGRVFLGLQFAHRVIQLQGRGPIAVAGTMDFTRLLVAIANLDHRAAVDLLNAAPSLATVRLARRDEFFLAERLAQVYEGDTALHAAGSVTIPRWHET